MNLVDPFASLTTQDLIAMHKATKAEYVLKREIVGTVRKTIKLAERAVAASDAGRALKTARAKLTVQDPDTGEVVRLTYTNEEQQTKLLSRSLKSRGINATTDGDVSEDYSDA